MSLLGDSIELPHNVLIILTPACFELGNLLSQVSAKVHCCPLTIHMKFEFPGSHSINDQISKFDFKGSILLPL